MFNLISDQGNTILNQNEIAFTPHQSFKMPTVDENAQQYKCLSTPLGEQIGAHIGIV